MYVILGKEAPYIGKEGKFQSACARYLDSIGAFYCHVPNGGRRNEVDGTILKRQGVKRGVPDILIFDKKMAIELKVNGRTISEFQHDFLTKLSENGWYCYVCYNLDSFIELFE